MHLYASAPELIFTICCARGLCHWGKGHIPSKLKMNWMSSGCQGIINNQLGSLMITLLPESHCNLGPGQRCSAIDVLYKPSVSEPWPTRHEITVNWIVLGQTQRKRGSEEVAEYKRHWKTLVILTLYPQLSFFNYFFLFLIPPFQPNVCDSPVQSSPVQ